jgi:Secretion system C-terminal sorting domain
MYEQLYILLLKNLNLMNKLFSVNWLSFFSEKRNFILLILLLTIIDSQFILAQAIWTNPITGTNPNTSNPYTTGQTVTGNLTVSGIGRGSGIVGNNANDRYNASDWPNASLSITDYFTFTLIPDANRWINLSSFIYTGQASNGNGPTSFAFRSSLDGFSANIGSPTETGTTILLGSPSYIHLTSPIEFRFYAWGANSNPGTFSINSFSFNGLVNLPIQLSDFNITLNPNPSLQWITFSELNNDYFSIEHSRDGNHFTEIAKIDGQGTSDKQNDYTFTDLSPYQGLNYYQLKQIDLDGIATVFPMKSVLVSSKGIVVYPTLFQNSINIEVSESPSQNWLWNIIDLQGRKIQSGEIISSKLLYSINTEKLLSGPYILQLKSGTFSSLNKLIKF